MKRAALGLINFFIYSSLHISIGAAVFCLETFHLAGSAPHFNYLAFVFFSTMLTYCVHRIVGLNKLRHVKNEGRFRIIRKYTHHIRLYAFISFVCVIWYFLQLDRNIQMMLIPAAVISALYTFPVYKGLRLRDGHYIKIFLIAVVWGYICGFLPGIISGLPIHQSLYFAIEKSVFILAITIPFDIRDELIDRGNKVQTLVHWLGVKQAWNLAYCLLVACTFFWILMPYPNIQINLSLVVSAFLLCALSFHLAKAKKSDYYYSGLIDGLILLRSLLIIAAVTVIQ